MLGPQTSMVHEAQGQLVELGVQIFIGDTLILEQHVVTDGF